MRGNAAPQSRPAHLSPGVVVAPKARGRVEDPIYRAAGFHGPRRLELPDHAVVRTEDDLVAAVFSLSSSTPHLFGDRVDVFEAALRRLLGEVSPDGLFSEQMRGTTVDVWRPSSTY